MKIKDVEMAGSGIKKILFVDMYALSKMIQRYKHLLNSHSTFDGGKYYEEMIESYEAQKHSYELINARFGWQEEYLAYIRQIDELTEKL